MEEYMKVAQCWVDISEDSTHANNQTSARMWDRIAARYNSVKPSRAYKGNKEQLRKCWDRLKLHVNNFRNIYTKFRDGRGNGESMEDVIQKSMVEYQSKYGQFKFYNILLILKDKPKFDGGISAASSAAKRTKTSPVAITRAAPHRLWISTLIRKSVSARLRLLLGVLLAKRLPEPTPKERRPRLHRLPGRLRLLRLLSSWPQRSRSLVVFVRCASIGLYLTHKTAFIRKLIRPPDEGLRR